MAKRLALLCVVVVLGFVGVMMAQQFPAWERLLSYGVKTDQTPVPSMKMGNHMQMSLKGKLQSGDEQRAEDIIASARQVLVKYADVNTALRDGYKPFFPRGKVGEEVHYTNYRLARWSGYDHPRSLLYKRTAEGMQAVGVMYTAAQDATAEQLNALVPLSITTWHRHVDFCGGPKNLPRDEQFGPQAEFGFRGSIHTQDGCQQAHGLWIPVVFGWMTHVYPNAKSPSEVWSGMPMNMDAESEMQTANN